MQEKSDLTETVINDTLYSVDQKLKTETNQMVIDLA